MRGPDSLDLYREPDGVLNLAPFSFFTVAQAVVFRSTKPRSVPR
jgi:hypothetical protein